MPHPFLSLKPHVHAERKRECGCAVVAYFDAGIDGASGRFVTSEAKLGFIPCSKAAHSEMAVRIGDVWWSPENLRRFHDVRPVDSFMTLFEEAMLADPALS